MTLEKLSEILLRSNVRVAVFVGAGISTQAGIPDFRSPDTGLYHNLSRLNLPYAEAVFDIEYFRENPKAFYVLADELFPGKFLPTKFHYFVRLLQDKDLLKRCYTQNIDTLERIAGIKDEYIVEAHGSFAGSHCIDCDEEMTLKQLRENMDISDDKVPRCLRCEGYVKPDIVFFGEALPTKFFDLWEEDVDQIDLALVAGTSLTVFPFAGLPAELPKSCTRVLINKEHCGDFKSGARKNDIVALQDCDAAIDELVDLCGWQEEFHKLIEDGKAKLAKDVSEVEKAEDRSREIATLIAKEEEAYEDAHEEVNVELMERLTGLKLGEAQDVQDENK